MGEKWSHQGAFKSIEGSLSYKKTYVIKYLLIYLNVMKNNKVLKSRKKKTHCQWGGGRTQATDDQYWSIFCKKERKKILFIHLLVIIMMNSY